MYKTRAPSNCHARVWADCSTYYNTNDDDDDSCCCRVRPLRSSRSVFALKIINTRKSFTSLFIFSSGLMLPACCENVPMIRTMGHRCGVLLHVSPSYDTRFTNSTLAEIPYPIPSLKYRRLRSGGNVRRETATRGTQIMIWIYPFHEQYIVRHLVVPQIYKSKLCMLHEC